ncbi:STY4528 family pathogenicity island replication protein [Stutzerimonas stutzeri]|uniref:STY4528 family pathogenicity island replication protein n=1 Tax=Stutzerimonas stutzeri TaxID=316 RepID=UPI002446FEC7|nr:STY4528 family pathogenicity island replication protein [Pseudomonas chengduensis]MDH1624084.1 STY4528 family pathogenicity island replication protein [Pseudomonas chengduensis]MDH1866783.1 STY4528 family pathogenicity island replication protein [Pseudomonas chengduensis]
MTTPQTPAHTHNTQFATPTALMLDARLTPLERNGWQVLRMLRAPDGISSLASLGQLRRYLTSIPLGQKAGHETTWRVLVVLRLTGWISLAGQQRDPLTGHVLSEQYQVHDHSHRFAQACALDPTLPQLLREATAHDNNQVARVAAHIQVALAQAPSGDDDSDDAGPMTPRASDESTTAPSPEHPADIPPAQCTSVPPQNTTMAAVTEGADPTYSMYKYKKRTYRAREEGAVDNPPALPPCLGRLAPRQQHDVVVALRRLPEAQRQDVLDELQARSQNGTVRNVIAYFFGLIKRVLAGEFRFWAGRKLRQPASPATAVKTVVTPPPSSTQVPEFKPADPELVRAHIANIRSMLNRPANAGELANRFLHSKGWRPGPA